MTSRCWAGLTGAVGFPIGVVMSLRLAAKVGWFNPWMVMLVLPLTIVFGPFVGFAVAWFAAAFLEGAMEERQTGTIDPELSEKPFVPPASVERIIESRTLETTHCPNDERIRE
jgi:hypothetical protein